MGIPVKITPFHGPLRHYGRVSFQMNTSSMFMRWRTLEEMLPTEGLEGLFHDVISTLVPVLTLVESFIPGNTVFEGCWKLSHKMFPLVVSVRTSLPESESWTLVLDGVVDTFVDQITCFWPFNTTRLPSSDMVTTPDESFSGWFLLATHMTVNLGCHQIST